MSNKTPTADAYADVIDSMNELLLQWDEANG